MKRRVLFVTGTDTGVGKTVFAALLASHLRGAGRSVAALKPVCSGGRDDAVLLRAAAGGVLSLDETNPWHFRDALSPLLAARREKRRLKLAQVAAHVRRMQDRFETVIVEGAGGLLSPLGEDFDSRDLIEALEAKPIVICSNRLGAINQALLVLAALPSRVARRTPVVLMSPRRMDQASRSNPQLLAERIGPDLVHVLPWVRFPGKLDVALRDTRVRRALDEGLMVDG
jgi:dethiobiotin synthetase